MSKITLKKVARLTAQVITSASLIAGGLIVTQVVGLNPIGAFLVFTGVCFAFVQEEMTDEEYNESVREYFRERGQECPAWALRGGAK